MHPRTVCPPEWWHSPGRHRGSRSRRSGACGAGPWRSRGPPLAPAPAPRARPSTAASCSLPLPLRCCVSSSGAPPHGPRTSDPALRLRSRLTDARQRVRSASPQMLGYADDAQARFCRNSTIVAQSGFECAQRLHIVDDRLRITRLSPRYDTGI